MKIPNADEAGTMKPSQGVSTVLQARQNFDGDPISPHTDRSGEQTVIAKTLAPAPMLSPTPEEVAQDATTAFCVVGLPSASPFDKFKAVRLARSFMGEGMAWPEAIEAAATIIAAGRVKPRPSPYAKRG